MNDWMITPFSKRSDFPEVLTLDHKIQIFYERVTGWQLDIADKIANGVKDENGKVVKDGIKDSGFAVLNILLSYFEMISKYKKDTVIGWKVSDYFKDGIEMVFPELCKDHTWLAQKIYKKARCGLYHHGMTEGGIILKGEGLPPITPLKNQSLIINPHTLVVEMKKHFETYIKQIKTDQDFRSNFENRFDNDNT